MKNQEKYQKAFEYFKQPYNYKMGGTQTVILPNGKEQYFDDRQYYSGRGAKYNSSIKHDNLGTIKVTRKDYSVFLKLLKELEAKKIERIKAEKLRIERITQSEKENRYNIDKNGYVELSTKEQKDCYFDAQRLASTLEISVKDAELLKSSGKTYVFAKSKDGKTYQLYHPSLDCNSLSIHVEETKEERIQQFKPKEWQSAPFASIVGQTNNDNHFVC